MMLSVRVSPKTSVPTTIAVIGSKTPNTDAFVAPIFLVATASVAVDMIVGSIARPTRLNQSRLLSIPAIISLPVIAILTKNITAPTDKA